MNGLKTQLTCVALGDQMPPLLGSFNVAEYDGYGELRCCLDSQMINWDNASPIR